jgi:GDPmannose 4,6-dehydratase
MRVLITGGTGQDGRFLSPLLRDAGHEVHICSTKPIKSLTTSIMTDLGSTQIHYEIDHNARKIHNLILNIEPDWIFNLAGLSSVIDSFSNARETDDINFGYVESVLRASNELNKRKEIRVYQASSSEIFGNVSSSPQNELTDFNPISPYGKSKLKAHLLCQMYREKFDLFVTCGILYNHESEKRPLTFVSRHVVSQAVSIARGDAEKLQIGNVSAKRDWGFAGDYVAAMAKMMIQEQPQDFIVASGKSRSVKELIETVFNAVGLDGKIDRYLSIEQGRNRSLDHANLIGDASKAHDALDWKPSLTFEGLIQRMFDFESENYESKN